MIVRVVFAGEFQEVELETAGAMSYVTEAGFIDLLKCTEIGVASAAPAVPFCGLAVRMKGFGHHVKNVHGFVTGRPTRGSPWSSSPEAIFTVYSVHGWKLVA